MTNASTLETIRLIIRDEWPEQLPNESLEMSTAIFYEGVGLDSVDGVTLVLALEESFGIAIDPDDLSTDTFATIGDLVRFVESRIEQDVHGEVAFRTSAGA